MRLVGHGIAAGLPDGWEGAIVRQEPLDLQRSKVHSFAADPVVTAATVRSLPVVHLANFPLPPDRGDFGSGAVDVMGSADVFVSLLEYGPENLGTALFARTGVPRGLTADDFDPLSLQRTRGGQAGYQEFFTVAGRPFCLYVVIGEHAQAPRLVEAANAVLSSLEIGPA